MTPLSLLLNRILGARLAIIAVTVVYVGLIMATVTLVDFEPDRVIRYLDAR